MLLNKRMRRLVATMAVVLTAIAVPACGDDSAESANCAWDDASLAIGGGATGGSYYLLGATLERLVDNDLDCAEATTAAGTSNEFARGGKDLYFTQPDAAYAAWSGEGGQGFEPGEQFEHTRAIAVGYPNIFATIVRADNPAQSVGDLTDSDVVGTSAGSTTPVLERLFELHGVHPRLTTITSFDQLMTALRQGQITAVNYGPAHPGPALVEAQESQDLRFLPYDEEALTTLLQDYPDYEITSIPDGTYEFQNGEYQGWARRTMLVGSAELDDDLVYQITRIFYERTAEFVAAVPNAEDFTIETLQTALDAGTIRIPFHPGARRYFEEHGVTFPPDVPIE